MILMINFVEKNKGSRSFIRNKHKIFRLLDYHNLYSILYNLDYKLSYLITIRII
jgi:hypothetical protein